MTLTSSSINDQAGISGWQYAAVTTAAIPSNPRLWEYRGGPLLKKSNVRCYPSRVVEAAGQPLGAQGPSSSAADGEKKTGLSFSHFGMQRFSTVYLFYISTPEWHSQLAGDCMSVMMKLNIQMCLVHSACWFKIQINWIMHNNDLFELNKLVVTSIRPSTES